MPTKTPKFAAFTAEEQPHVNRIIDRTMEALTNAGVRHISRLDVQMDLSAVHARVPLRLAELADADNFNFSHDVMGIMSHIDRNTGELKNCFLPRFAA